MTASPGRVILAFIIVTLIWGSTWLVIHDQLAIVAPSWSICYRFLVGSAAMFAYSAAIGQPWRLGRGGLAFAGLIGFALFFVNFNFVYRAEAYVTSGVVAMVFALLIVPNSLFARIFLGTRIGAGFVVGSSISLVGMAMLFWHELAQAIGGGERVVLGIGFTLIGVVGASIANVMQASTRGRALPPAATLGWAMLIGAAINAAFALATAGPPTFDPRPAYLGGILYLGILGSAVTFPLYMFVIRQIGPARAAYSSVLTPVIAMALSTVFEGYRWSALAAAGAVLALAGLVVAIRERNPAA
ncbi:MAG: EamA-like transporter family protein [Rhizorhabdus sp.]|nr:EamA-like transporter family protein [Rhizorhabdus sp.]